MLISGIALISMIYMCGLVIYLTNKHKEKLTCMTGMMIAMTSGMMSSLVIGTIVGTMLNGELLSPTMIGVIAGMGIGYFTGRPVTLMAALDGMMAGVMGGMMGAMLGVMVIYQSPHNTILFMAVIFLVIMMVLIKLIREEAGLEGNKPKSPTKSNTHQKAASFPSQKIFIGLLAFIVILASYMMFGTDFMNMKNAASISSASESANTPGTKNIVEAIQKDGYQEVNIDVGRYGYSPEEFRLKAGVPAKLHFQKDYKGGCLSALVMPDFNIKQSLKVGSTTVEITPDKPGKYQFTCGMGMYGATISVES